jgi:DNA replicative helicase MCM subunit Mcm2 (Cdc46/Mcm family)
VISGIIISCTKSYIKASELKIKCRNCLLARTIKIAPGQFPFIPMVCTGQNDKNKKCPPDPFVALPDSHVMDTQSMKIQENP